MKWVIMKSRLHFSRRALLKNSSIAKKPSLLHHSSPFSTSSRLFERAPTFTTSESPLPTESIHDLSKPLPPTDLPVEDYASPLLHTASIFGKLFRYAVFGSVGVVLVGVGSWAGIHTWVEKVALAGPKRSGASDEDEASWADEVEGWSGSYLGGGTDPRLGSFARAAIRAAWISQQWGSGVASPMSSIASPSPFASPVPGSMPGGAMIGSFSSTGSGSARANRDQVNDAGWLAAEEYLVYALGKASDKGVSLVFPGPGPVDQAALEVEQRLAGLRERLGGRYKLELAREGWERIYYALSSSSPEDAPPRTASWERRETLRATRKLGEISARIASTWDEGSPERRLEMEKAKGWFVGGLLPALSELETGGVPPIPIISPVPPTSMKSVPPSSSFFGFWSRSHPPSSPSSATNSSLTPLIALLDRTYAYPDPAISRYVLRSLVSLETFLARTRNLSSALAVQTASINFANALHRAPGFSSQPSALGFASTTSSPESKTIVHTTADKSNRWKSDAKWASSTLSELFLISRAALLATHYAEVSLALRQAEGPALLLLQGAINDCDRVLIAAAALGGGKSKSTSSERVGTEKGLKELMRDARLTGGMAARLAALVHEKGCGGFSKYKNAKGVKSLEWCGGDAQAEAFYAKAMQFSGGATYEAGGKAEEVKQVVDEKGFEEAEEGFKRTRSRVLEKEVKK